MRTCSDRLPRDAGVVVIGGGIVGAEHRVPPRRGRDRRRRRSSSAPSSRAARRASRSAASAAQFSDALNVQLAARSLAAYDRFAQTPGADIDLDKVGYLFLLRTPEHVDAVRGERRDPERARHPDRHDRPPPRRTRSARRSIPTRSSRRRSRPSDGHARPAVAAIGVRRRGPPARRAGRHAAARSRGIERPRRRDRGGAHVAGDRSARRPSSARPARGRREIGAMAGVELDVRPVRRQIAFTAPLAAPRRDLPFTIDYDSTFYFHGAGDGRAARHVGPRPGAGVRLDYTDDWLPALRRGGRALRAGARRPAGQHGWAGLYEMTPGRQRAHRRGARRSAASSTRPASRATASARRRPPARSSATWSCGADAVRRRHAAARRALRRARARSSKPTSSEEPR